MDWDGAHILDTCRFLYPRCILESWHIHQQHHPINRERGPLPSLFSSFVDSLMLSVLSFPLGHTINCQFSVCFCIFTYICITRCQIYCHLVFASHSYHVALRMLHLLHGLLSIPGYCFSFGFVYSLFG